MAFQIKYIYNLVDRISPQLRKIEGNLRKTERQLQKTARVGNKTFNRMEKSTKSLSSRAILPLTAQVKQLVIAYAGIVGITKATRILGTFGQEMAKVKAFTQATAPELEKIRELTKKLGITTEFTAGQAASAAALLAKAGFSINEILASLPKTLNLATAGTLGLEQATDVAIGSLRGFGIEADNMQRVTDVLALAAIRGNTVIGELGIAMSFVASIAKISNVPLERVGASLSVLADSAIKGTKGGTGLRRIFSELANPTREAIKVFQKLGLTQADIDVKGRGFITVLKTLAPLTKGVRGVANAFKVFGDRGAPAFAVLSANIEKIERLNKEMINAKGATEKLAKIMRDTLTGDAKALLSAIEGNVLGLGEDGLTGVLRRGTQAATKFFRAFQDKKEFDKLGTTTKSLIVTVKGLGTVFKNIFKIITVGFKVALSALDKLIQGFILIKDLLKIDEITEILSAGFKFGKNLFSGEQKIENINTTNTINNAQASQRQEPQQPVIGGRLDVNLNNLPRGSNANFTPDLGNNLSVGIQQTFAKK